MKTYQTKKQDIERKWYLVDAEGKTLGRLATKIADYLRGKHKPLYAPNMDCGDYIVVINAAKIKVTGRKMEGKIYYHHTGHPKGMKSIQLRTLLDEKPLRVLEHAIKGMIPANKLKLDILKKLKLYPGPEHKHQAQKLEPIAFEKLTDARRQAS